MVRSTVVITNSNLETNMSNSTVVKMVTATHEDKGSSSRSEINLEPTGVRSTVDGQKTATYGMIERRGYQHVYKNKKTPTSRRVHEAYNVSQEKGLPASVMATRRDKAKEKKIESLMRILPSKIHSLPSSMFAKNQPPIFFSGRKNFEKKPVKNAIMLSAIEELKVIDTQFGAQLVLEGGDTVFTLIPRQYAIDRLTHVKEHLKSLYALENAQPSSEKRGKERLAVPEDNGKYITVGLKPNRGSRGINECWPKKLKKHHRMQIRNIMTRCEEAAKGYVKSNELRGLRMAQLFGNWPQIDGVSSMPIWGSLACGKNYYLNSHLDDDFFYSLTTIASEWGLQPKIDRYNVDAEVCNYFTFAEQGLAVALRPGDMLVFNPRYQHCLSSRTSAYIQKDVYCLSLYLKTAVVGGNDNSHK